MIIFIIFLKIKVHSKGSLNDAKVDSLFYYVKDKKTSFSLNNCKINLLWSMFEKIFSLFDSLFKFSRWLKSVKTQKICMSDMSHWPVYHGTNPRLLIGLWTWILLLWFNCVSEDCILIRSEINFTRRLKIFSLFYWIPF